MMAIWTRLVKLVPLVHQGLMERVRKWAVLGRLAAIERSRQAQRSKLAFEADLAARLGLSRASLRNYADAVRLVRNVHDLHLRAMLFRSSSVAAAVASRWFQRDPSTLLDYLSRRPRSAPQRIVDDRALLSAERDARRALGRSAPHRLAAPDNINTQLERFIGSGYRRLRPELTRLVPRLEDWAHRGRAALIMPEDPLSTFLGLTQVLAMIDVVDVGLKAKWTLGAASHLPALAFIEIPERVVLERYRTEARNIWTRALAASAYVELGVLVLADSAARRHLLSQIPLEGTEWVHHPGQFRAGQSDPQYRRGQSRPILARLPRHGGAILVSTRRSLLIDLFG